MSLYRILMVFFIASSMYFPAECMTAPQKCNMCLMDKQDNELVCLSCGHSDCHECLKAMVDPSIKEKANSYLQCPDCKAPLSQSDIAKITNNQAERQNQQQEGLAYIYASNLLNQAPCAHKVSPGTRYPWFMHRVRFYNPTKRSIADRLARFIQRNNFSGPMMGFERVPRRARNDGQVHELRIETQMNQQQFQQLLNRANKECF